MKAQTGMCPNENIHLVINLTYKISLEILNYMRKPKGIFFSTFLRFSCYDGTFDQIKCCVRIFLMFFRGLIKLRKTSVPKL